MKASSIDQHPPGTDQAAEQGGRVQGPGRVGRIADHDQVGAAGIRSGCSANPSAGSSSTRSTRCPAVQQRGLRFGELRMHHHRLPRSQRPGQQGERLRAAGGEQHLLDRSLVPPGHRGDRGGRSRIAAQGPGGRVDRLGEPRRRRRASRTLTAKSTRWRRSRRRRGGAGRRGVVASGVVLGAGLAAREQRAHVWPRWSELVGRSAGADPLAARCAAAANRAASSGCPAQCVCR